MMREDNPATEVMNAMCECANACALLVGEAPGEHRAAILDGVSWFVEAAPLIDLPTVEGPKDMIRRAGGIAGRVKDAMVAWGDASAPPDALATLAREFLAAVEMPDLGA